MNNEHDRPAADDRISTVYRDLAREQTPPHLDTAVLREATTAARTRYGILRTWVRPAAWAAMIGLSLVIVLEVTQLPDGNTLPVGENAIEGDDSGNAGDKGRLRLKIEADAPAEAEPDAAVRQDIRGAMKFSPAPASAPALERRGSVQSAATLEEAATRSPCADAEAEGAEAWHACIRNLLDRGETELAETELARFRAAYPDFAPDNTHK